MAVAGLGSLYLSMAATYAAAPALRAYMKRQTPPVDVPLFDFGDRRGTRRLFKLVWSARIPPERRHLRRLLIAARAFYVAAPLLMVGAFVVAAGLPGTGSPTSRPRQPGEPPPVTLAIKPVEEPGR